MKRFYIACIAVCILIVSTDRLISQDKTSSSDSTWIYQFTSETDSTFTQLKFRSVYDTASFEETILLNTNVLDGDWQLGTKFERVYNPSGLVSSILQYTWDAILEQWYESNLFEVFYDEYGNDTLYYTSYKAGSDEWISAQGNRYENTYNEKDQLIQEINYKGYPGQESEYVKFEYSYDDSGNKILTIRYNFGMDWGLNARYETSFDNEGREVEELAYSRFDDEWVESYNRIYVWDVDGNMTVNEFNTWDMGSEQWIMTNRDEFTYDAYGKKLQRIRRAFVAHGEPLETTRYEYFYNLSGKLETTVISVLEEGTGEYVLTQKEFKRYGGDYFILCDSICTGESYSWQGESIGTGGTYQKDFDSAMGLDSIYTLYLKENPNPASFTFTGTTEVVQKQEELYIAPEDAALSYSWLVENGTIVSGAENDTLTVRWENLGSGEVAAWALNIHGCGSDTTSVLVSIGSNSTEEYTGGSFVIYPVPVNDVLRIDAEYESLRIELVDASGRVVVDKEGLEADLSHLDSGVYLVRLRDQEGNLIGTRKITVL